MRGLCYFFLSVLTQVNSQTLEVTGFVGHNVTLPCSYDGQTRGVLSFCWGLGKVPRFKCSNAVLSSQDGEVSWRQSSRYQLRGSVADGDVSLTILHAEQSDAGVYGCRVEIPGWFNDYKVNIHLAMEEGPVEQPVTVDYILQTEAQDMLITSSLIGTEAGDMMETRSTQEYFSFKAFLGTGNISRMAAILFVTIIIILVFIFWRMLLFRRTRLQLKTSPPENIYETIPVRRWEEMITSVNSVCNVMTLSPLFCSKTYVWKNKKWPIWLKQLTWSHYSYKELKAKVKVNMHSWNIFVEYVCFPMVKYIWFW